MRPGEASLLRLYLNADDRSGRRPLYEAVVKKAREMGLAGASVFSGEIGYGCHRVMHDALSEYTFTGAPLVVEVVESGERINDLLTEFKAVVGEGLATVSTVRVAPDVHPTGSSEDLPMQIEGEGQRVTVYLGRSDTWHGTNLAVALVERCRKLGFAGATVSRGVMGFGKNSRIHRAHLLGLSEDLPEKVEIVDRPERVSQLLPVLEEMVSGGLVVVETVRIIRYQHHAEAAKK